MGGYKFFGIFWEHQVTYLTARIYTIQHSIVKSVPEFDSFVSRTASARQNSMIVRTPSDALDCCSVAGEFAYRSGGVGAPDEEFIVIASGS